MLSKKDLIKGFRNLGLKSGDVVLVHSSFKSFGGVEGGPQTVIDAFLEVLSKEGTLIVPTFTFKFCEEFNKTGKGYFNLTETPSEMGIITEFVRKMSGSKRTVNPIYSVAIHGKLADELSLINSKEVFGEESIFGTLHRVKGKIMIIGLDYDNSMTFFHYIEQMEGCDYRIPKTFYGMIILEDRQYEDGFTMLVRDLDRDIHTAVNPMGKVLESVGLVKIEQIGQSTVRLMNAKEVYDTVSFYMKKNPQLLYKIGDQ